MKHWHASGMNRAKAKESSTHSGRDPCKKSDETLKLENVKLDVRYWLVRKFWTETQLNGLLRSACRIAKNCESSKTNWWSRLKVLECKGLKRRSGTKKILTLRKGRDIINWFTGTLFGTDENWKRILRSGLGRRRGADVGRGTGDGDAGHPERWLRTGSGAKCDGGRAKDSVQGWPRWQSRKEDVAESMQMFEARLQEGWVGKTAFWKVFQIFFKTYLNVTADETVLWYNASVRR